MGSRASGLALERDAQQGHGFRWTSERWSRKGMASRNTGFQPVRKGVEVESRAHLVLLAWKSESHRWHGLEARVTGGGRRASFHRPTGLARFDRHAVGELDGCPGLGGGAVDDVR